MSVLTSHPAARKRKMPKRLAVKKRSHRFYITAEVVQNNWNDLPMSANVNVHHWGSAPELPIMRSFDHLPTYRRSIFNSIGYFMGIKNHFCFRSWQSC